MNRVAPFLFLAIGLQSVRSDQITGDLRVLGWASIPVGRFNRKLHGTRPTD